MSTFADYERVLWRIHIHRRRIGEWESPAIDCVEDILGASAHKVYSDREEADQLANRIRSDQFRKPHFPGWHLTIEVHSAMENPYTHAHAPKTQKAL
jgi:hypothetical protein